MKLIIIDHGDPSVGISATSWAVDVPFDDVDMRDEFIEEIMKVYKEYAQGKLTAYYEEATPGALSGDY